MHFLTTHFRVFFLRFWWFLMTTFCLVLFFVTIPLRFERLHLLTTEELQAIEQLGLSREWYASYFTLWDIVFFVGFFTMGIVIFWHKTSELMPVLASLSLLTFSIAGDPGFLQTLANSVPAWAWLALLVRGVANGFMFTFWYLFPDGHFRPSWTRPCLLIWCLWVASWFFWPHLNPYFYLEDRDAPLLPLSSFIILGFCLTAVYAQIYRYRHVSNEKQRQQTRWVAGSMALATMGYILFFTPLTVLPVMRQVGPEQMLYLFIGIPLLVACSLLVPFSIGVSVLRYHLWNLDPIINRALAYGGATVIIVAVYILVVSFLGALFQAQGNPIIAFMGAGVVAVLFHPLRVWLQRGVNRLMYGARDEPYKVIAQLGERLEAAFAPTDVLHVIVETVAQSLKLPYVAITIKQGETIIQTVPYPAVSGNENATTFPENAFSIPLVYQGESLGELLACPRAGEEKVSAADKRLLIDVAHHAGVAVYGVQLVTELRYHQAALQHSRENLILAREEERRRLRRDLHDELAPALAGLSFAAGTIHDLVPTNPTRARDLATELQSAIRATIGDIRRLVYNLRPPALDEFGLVGALQARAVHFSHDNTLQITISANEPFPDLPAAVEVAAYRIIQEGINNVARHASAHACHVQLNLADALHIEISDDGLGLPESFNSGVGLHSIQERVEELGGSWKISRCPQGGTRLFASLPVLRQR